MINIKLSPKNLLSIIALIISVFLLLSTSNNIILLIAGILIISNVVYLFSLIPTNKNKRESE